MQFSHFNFFSKDFRFSLLFFQVALDLQRKSDAKQRKLESAMDMAAEPKGPGSNSSEERGKGPAAYFRSRRAKKKSLRANDSGEIRIQSSNIQSI